MDFDDHRHEFHVDFTSPPTVSLDFGNQLMFTSLVTVPGVPAIEASVAAGTPLFGSGLVPNAVMFFASCVVTGRDKKPLSAAQLSADFEFGFVQGILHTDIHLDYWGQRKSNGRSVLHITMPGTFEVDTDPATQPWTRVASRRFKVEQAPPKSGRPAGLKVSASFDDHPVYIFRHTVTEGGVPRFLRSVSFRRVFRTVFCFRDKTTGDFEAVSSTDWQIKFNHVVSYSNNGATRSVTDNSGGNTFPVGGNPANVNADDRSLMKMAKAGSPLHTPATLSARLGPAGPRTITKEDTNNDFDPSFWR